jgi:site-specific DNA recombinase
MARTKPGDATVAVGYLRVSTEDQDLGPQAQRASIEAWAAPRGLTVAQWYEDRVSGATPVDGRPGLLRALASLTDHGAGVLIAAKRDRIARDVVVCAMVERMVESAGARVITADGLTADQTPEGALMRTMVDAFASYERSMIALRTKNALAVKRAKGEPLGRAAIGYRYEAGALVVDPGEAALVDRIKGMRSRGLSIRRVAELLNAEGITIRGGRVHENTLARVLRRAA